MRKLTKLLVLALSLALLVGSIFAVASFAAEEDDLGIDGASRTRVDFTDVVFDRHISVDAGVAATPTISSGTAPIAEGISSKYGHIRTVTSPIDGNTYYEWLFEVDDNGTSSQSDAMIKMTADETITSLGYYVLEYDMSTRTRIPGNMLIFQEVRAWEPGASGDLGAYRNRPELAKYSAANGKWTAGDNTFTFDANEWVHITVVYKFNPEFVTVEGVEKVNYKNSVANLYVNGQFMNSIKFMPDVDVATGSDVRLHYAGLGYSYGNVHTGTKADDSIAIDNVVKTKIPAAYAADTANDKLAPLFAAENPTTNVKDLCKAIVYTEGYALPETELGVASFLTEDGDEFVKATIEQAIALMKEYDAPGSTIKLYANRYHPLEIDYPCVIDLNGFTLQNGYKVSPELKVTLDAEEGTLTFAADPENSATFNYYAVDYANVAGKTPIVTQVIAPGNTVDPSVLDAYVPRISADGKNGLVFSGVKVYDETGTEVAFSEVGAEHAGKTYTVCPTFEVTTMENDVKFATELDGTLKFYDTEDIQAAATSGVMPANVKIVLLTDCIYSTTIYAPESSTFAIDLNGHKLSAKTANFLVGPLNLYVDYFFYSSKNGGVIDTHGYTLIQNKGIDTKIDNVYQYSSSYFFGYEDADTKATGRMTINFGDKLVYMNKTDADSIKFYNAEIHAEKIGILIQLAQARMDYKFEFDTCDLFVDGDLVRSVANSTNCDLTIKNSNVYGGGKVMFPAPGGNGSRDVILINSKMYNFEYGSTSVSSFSMDATSVVSFVPLANKYTIEGKSVHCCIPETVVIDGVTYVTGYQWLPEDTPYATFNYYGVAKDSATADTPIVKTMKVAIGGWWVSATAPGTTGLYFDPTVDMNNAYVTELRETVYDAEGNLVTKTAVEEADNGKTFSVYLDTIVTGEKVALDLCAYLKLTDNTYVPLVGDDIAAALTEALGSTVLPEGATLTLVRDCAMGNSLYYTNNKIDLAGNTLYYPHKNPEILPNAANAKLFFYSSQPGARVCVVPVSGSGASYFTEVNQNGAEAYIGYVDAETNSPYAIDFFTGAFAQVTAANAKLFIANANIAAFGGDNYGVFNFRKASTTNASCTLNNVNVFVDNRNPVFCIRENATDVVWNVNNSNIYNVGVARSLMGWYSASETELKATLNLNNTNVYGQFNMGALVSGQAVCTVNIVGTTVLSEVNEHVVLPEGFIAVPLQGTYTSAGMTIVAGGRYGGTEGKYGNITYSYGIQIMAKPAATVDANAYKAQAFQNMTLDTNVVVNLYIPVSEDILSVVYGKTHLLDKAMVETIGDKQYYVLAVELAPKYGNAQADVVVYFQDGQSVTFPMSVENYAKALFALDGTANAYVADSQKMMKYVLTYIKEVAVAFGGADAATIFAGMDIAVDTNVTVQEAVKDTTAVNTYVTHAALDLDAYAGFAFKVAKDFVGTIRIEMAGVEAVQKTYEEKTKAGENEVLVLENVPAYLFRGDVTITVTPAEGEAVTAQFNLATYVTANADAYAKALYAYTVEAQAYNTKYPTVNTVN